MSTVTTPAVSEVHVETESDGALLVRWVVEGGPIDVDVAVGPSPEGIDHEHAATVPAGETSVRLDGLPKGRHFVSVSPHGGGTALIAADRRVALEGLTNFRDLGGYPVRDGGRTRWGMVFRAEALHGLTQDDLVTYERLGIATVYDLRRDAERAARPNPVASEALVFLSQTIERSPLTGSGIMTEEDGQQILRTVYVGLLEHAGPQIGALLAGMSSAERLPAVFHCHAGKDRTGIAAALLLEVLGADRERVLDDYELTARYRFREQQTGSFERLVASGIPPEAAAGVLTAPRWAMSEALEVLDSDYGGIERYLLDRAGLDPAQVDALRTLLVTR